MHDAKRKHVKRKIAPLLTLVIILLIAGAIAILAPFLIVEMELRLDTETYEQFKAQARIASAEDSPRDEAPEAASPAQMREMAIAPQVAAPAFINMGKTGVDLAACKAENEDFIAWIQIPGTTVDYPVVLSNDTDYYLEHTFSGKKSYLGTLFSLGKPITVHRAKT